MNAELQHMAELVITAKSFLNTGAMPEMKMQKHIKEVIFVFAPQKRLFSNKVVTAHATGDWLAALRKKGLTGITLYANTKEDDINQLGFANGIRDITIGTGYQKDSAAWAKLWVFNQESANWTVSYKEIPKQGGLPAIDIDDPTGPLRQTLTGISALAGRIACGHFQQVFLEAGALLSKEMDMRSFPAMPEANERLYHAAAKAWVFGGMGSWNDSPPYMAKDKGLLEEYETLTADLYQRIMTAILYAVNCWQYE